MFIFKNIISVRNNVAVGTDALGSSSLVSSMSTHSRLFWKLPNKFLVRFHTSTIIISSHFLEGLCPVFFFFLSFKDGKTPKQRVLFIRRAMQAHAPSLMYNRFSQTFSACIKNAKSTALHSHLSTSLRFSSPQDTVNTMKKFGCTRLTARRPYSIWNPTCFESDLKWRTRAGVLGGGFAMSDRQKKQKTVTFLTLRVTPCWNVRKRTIPGQFQIVKNKPCHT